jgi:hypothetical protein
MVDTVFCINKPLARSSLQHIVYNTSVPCMYHYADNFIA